jgi:hypothetical protein
MVTIEVTGESIAALVLKHKQFLVLNGGAPLTVEQQAMGEQPEGPSFNDWLTSEMKITEVISPNGMWSYGPHALVFATDADAEDFQNRYMN